MTKVPLFVENGTPLLCAIQQRLLLPRTATGFAKFNDDCSRIIQRCLIVHNSTMPAPAQFNDKCFCAIRQRFLHGSLTHARTHTQTHTHTHKHTRARAHALPGNNSARPLARSLARWPAPCETIACSLARSRARSSAPAV